MPEPAPTPPLSTQEAADRLHVSPATVVRLIQAGELKAHKKTATNTNSPYLVDADSVAEYDRRRKQPPDGPTGAGFTGAARLTTPPAA